jgi:hypothetical protein
MARLHSIVLVTQSIPQTLERIHEEASIRLNKSVTIFAILLVVFETKQYPAKVA